MRLCYSLPLGMALLVLASTAGLAGCGKKGPLYHPTEAQTQAAKDKAKQAKREAAHPP